MKREGRTTLRCTKNTNKWDSFTVVVRTADKDSAKKNYESQGYSVTICK